MDRPQVCPIETNKQITRDERVKQSIADVLNDWIESLGGDIVSLLNHLDVTKNEAVVESALRSIFPKRTLDLEKFKTANITPSFALYWRVYCEYVRATKVNTVVT